MIKIWMNYLHSTFPNLKIVCAACKVSYCYLGCLVRLRFLSFKGAYYIKAYTWYDTTSQSRWRFKCYIDQFVRISL